MVLAWASVLPPALGFTALGILLSVATRSSAAGIGLPVVIGLLMQLVAFVDGPEAGAAPAHHLCVRRLARGPVRAGLYGPLVHGTAVSVIYLIVCLMIAHRLLQRREIGR